MFNIGLLWLLGIVVDIIELMYVVMFLVFVVVIRFGILFIYRKICIWGLFFVWNLILVK